MLGVRYIGCEAFTNKNFLLQAKWSETDFFFASFSSTQAKKGPIFCFFPLSWNKIFHFAFFVLIPNRLFCNISLHIILFLSKINNFLFPTKILGYFFLWISFQIDFFAKFFSHFFCFTCFASFYACFASNFSPLLSKFFSPFIANKWKDFCFDFKTENKWRTKVSISLTTDWKVHVDRRPCTF